MKSVVITGVAGFLGRYAARQFSMEGWRVIGLDDVAPHNVALGEGARYIRMKLPAPGFNELLRAERPDALVHCAGSASVPLSVADPAPDFHANTVLTFELLDALRKDAPGCRMLLLSSAAVYGEPASMPVQEEATIAPLSPYGFHKRQCELLCEEFSCVYGLKSASVRIFSAYGPGLRRQVIWDICQKALGAGGVRLHGTGNESRDFIHAADIARALVLITNRAPAHGEIYNLATGRETTIAELASLLIRALGRSCVPEFDGVNPSGNPLRWQADVTRLTGLGFFPDCSLEKGLEEVAAWSLSEAVSK